MSKQHLGYRNSTIKQQQEQANNNKGLQSDSSISMHEQNDAHYYDLDYSDENINQGIVSSSDQNQREITHEEFMQMIVTNQQRNNTESDFDQYQYLQKNQFDYHRHHQFSKSRNIQSHQFKRHLNKKHTPQTRDKSYQFNSYQINHLRNKQQKNDPQKSSNNKIKLSKQVSFNNNTNIENSVRQFRIDSFLNPYSQQQRQSVLQNERNRRQKKPQIFQRNQQDQSFSLITLPQYDDEGHYQSSISIVEKENIPLNRQQQKNRDIRKKYQNVGKLRTGEEDNYYQKLNWRYQQAKLKFMDNFLPEPLKIGTNTYNMLKYINKKHQFTYNMLMM